MQLFIQSKKINTIDSFLLPHCVRIQVSAICHLEKITNQYFIRQKSVRVLLNYYREIGFINTCRKMMSRLRETIRNDKYIYVGLGNIIDTASPHFSVNTPVLFFATNHPACAERVIIHENLITPLPDHLLSKIHNNQITVYGNNHSEKWWRAFSNLFAWTPYSGLPSSTLSSELIRKMENCFSDGAILKRINYTKSPVCEKMELGKTGKCSSKQQSAILFGYGNYAKTMILPNLNRQLKLTSIHEIDSAQIIPLKKHVRYDTSPFLRDSEHADVVIVAGYHHTHADIAAAALDRNCSVIVEKPLVTTRAELETLTAAMKKTTARLYACFQRRYHPFNDYFYQDANIKKVDPISYFAIVYEEYLPAYHWYRWPNSCSAVISNGCHWIDHFLFLNHYAAVIDYSARKTRSGDVIVHVELENEAVLSLTLSHKGSSRIGMQDYIELRTRDTTAKIMNSNHYRCDNRARILRDSTVNKFVSYRRMYRMISDDIMNRDGASLHDQWEKVKQSGSLILSLDETVQNVRPYHDERATISVA